MLYVISKVAKRYRIADSDYKRQSAEIPRWTEFEAACTLRCQWKIGVMRLGTISPICRWCTAWRTHQTRQRISAWSFAVRWIYTVIKASYGIRELWWSHPLNTVYATKLRDLIGNENPYRQCSPLGVPLDESQSRYCATERVAISFRHLPSGSCAMGLIGNSQ